MTQSRLVVVSAAVTFEGVTLEDGTLLAVELDQPRKRFALLHLCGDVAEVISLHVAEMEAVTTCKKLAAHMEMEAESMEAQPEGRTLQ